MAAIQSLARCLVLAGLLGAVGVAAAADAGDGLSVPASGLGWDRWQGRTSMSSDLPLWRAGLDPSVSAAGLRAGGFSLMGDYYFIAMPLGMHGSGGFRATSGVLLGSGGSLWSGGSGSTWGLSRHSAALVPGDSLNDLGSTVPYVGVGYSGLTGVGGWGFAADVGLLGRSSNDGMRLGRGAAGAQSLDDLLRDLRFAPVVQLGVSYSF